MRVPSAGRFLVPPDSGHVNRLHMLAKVTESQSRGALFIFEQTLLPGARVSRHVHESEDECAYIAAGEVRYLVGAERFVARAGAYVMKPRGVEHEWRNDGAAPARLIEIAVPGRIEGFYRELGALLGAAPAGAAEQRVAVDALARRYGIRGADVP